MYHLINEKNIDLLTQFIEKSHSKTFRYYETRSVEIIKNHIVTVIVTDDNNNDIVGYGHLDFENCVWLGICVLEKYRGRGFGKKIMEKLIEKARENEISEIQLTVDKENIIAKKLYEKFDFEVIKESETFYRMKRNKL